MESDSQIQKGNKTFYSFYKEITDITGAILGMILFSLLFVIVPILIKLDSKGPVIHKRRVSGKDDVPFYFYKFRTMIDHADEVAEEWKKKNSELYQEYMNNIKLEKDPRVTRVGEILRKTSLDELPQFFNVLKGEMSLVGPRPIVEDEKNKYDSGCLKKRFSVKPGITGCWQVNRENGMGYQGRVKMDMYYIEHQCLSLDLKIILKTVWVFFLKGQNR